MVNQPTEPNSIPGIGTAKAVRPSHAIKHNGSTSTAANQLARPFITEQSDQVQLAMSTLLLNLHDPSSARVTRAISTPEQKVQNVTRCIMRAGDDCAYYAVRWALDWPSGEGHFPIGTPCERSAG